MTKLKKISVWATACFVFFAALLSVLILLSDKLINRERILNKSQAGASQAVNGKVELKRLGLSFFPLPNIVIHQVSFSIPEKADGTIESLTIYPQILPLFTGKFLASRVKAKTPDIKLQLPENQAPKDKQQKPFSIEVVKANMGAALNVISSKAPGLDIIVENGRLNVVKADHTYFEVKDIHARIDLPANTVNLNIQCKSDRWESIFLKGSIHSAEDKSSLTLRELKLDPSGLNLSGKLEINHLPRPPSPSFTLELKSNNMDILAAREIALDLTGDIPVVQDIFTVLKAGKLPFIALSAHGNSLEDLGKLDNMNIQGHMLDGNIFVSGVDLDLTQVKGDVTFSKGILYGNNLEARLQNAQGRQGTLKLGFEGEDAPFHLEVTIDTDLTQLPSVLTPLVDNESFVKELTLIKELKGKGTGRLVLGERLSAIETQVEVTSFNLSADYRRLPSLLTIKGAHFSYKDDKVILKNATGSMGQSSFSDISLQLDLKDSPYLELKAGQSTFLMDEIYPWLSSLGTLQNKLQSLKPLKGVLSLAELNFQGPISAPEKWRFQTSGDLVLQQGLNISTDIALNPDALDIKKLIVKDNESNASVKLTSANRTFDLSFRGNLSKATIDSLMVENHILGGWIKGDFHTSVLLDQLVNSTAKGNIQAKALVLPWKKNAPIAINNLDLEAKKDNLWLESASFSFGGNRFDLKGNVNSSTDEFIFDMDLSADVLNIDNLKQALGTKKKEKHHKEGQKFKTNPVRGLLKLKTEKLIYEGLTWSPFYSDITINNDTATVAVTKADICGIATPGNLKISPQKISFDFKPVVRDQRLQSTLFCLADKSVKVDGNFDFEGNITAQNVDESFLGALNGDFEFSAGKGRFYSGQFHGALLGIVQLLSITEIFRGKLPDIGQEGFGYNSIQAQADIQNGKIILKKVIVDSPSMNIVGQGSIDLTNKQVALTALVAPLRTVDAIVNKIPLVKDIMGGSFLSIPFSIKGPMEDLEVTPLSTTKVDSGLLGIMRRTLDLPVQIIQPAFSNEGKK